MSVTPAPPAPTASPAPFVPVEALTAPRDRFRCDRLHATLTAEDCIERQKRADVAEAAREKQPGVSPFASRWSTQFATCRRCPVGDADRPEAPEGRPRAHAPPQHRPEDVLLGEPPSPRRGRCAHRRARCGRRAPRRHGDPTPRRVSKAAQGAQSPGARCATSVGTLRTSGRSSMTRFSISLGSIPSARK